MDQEKIFISFSTRDQIYVKRLCEKIELAGGNLFLSSKDILAGKWEKQVESGIDSCKYFVVILSKASVESDHVQDEIAFAKKKKKEIIPIKIHDVEIPFALTRYQCLDLKKNYELDFSKLQNALNLQVSDAVEGSKDSRFHSGRTDIYSRKYVLLFLILILTVCGLALGWISLHKNAGPLSAQVPKSELSTKDSISKDATKILTPGKDSSKSGTGKMAVIKTDPVTPKNPFDHLKSYTKRKLPNGKIIEISPLGVETSVLKIIEDVNRRPDSTKWYYLEEHHTFEESKILSDISFNHYLNFAKILDAYPNVIFKMKCPNYETNTPAIDEMHPCAAFYVATFSNNLKVSDRVKVEYGTPKYKNKVQIAIVSK